jgi:hypothetical protein
MGNARGNSVVRALESGGATMACFSDAGEHLTGRFQAPWRRVDILTVQPSLSSLKISVVPQS